MLIIIYLVYCINVLHTNIQFHIPLNIKSSNKSIITSIKMIYAVIVNRKL